MTETGSRQINTQAEAGSAALASWSYIVIAVTRGWFWCLGFLTDLTASELKCAPGLGWRA